MIARPPGVSAARSRPDRAGRTDRHQHDLLPQRRQHLVAGYHRDWVVVHWWHARQHRIGGRQCHHSGTPAAGQLAQWTDATHIQGADASTFVFNCGRLEYVSATALSFKPYNGDRIKINGTVLAIPSGGITGLANTSVFVNGTGASNFAASTLYYVYAFNNSGTITADFSTTTHATSSTAGNVGVEIKSGDNTRTVIGMIRTNASSQFQSDAANRLVISWFNCRDLALAGVQASASTASTTAVELSASSRANFLTWGEEHVEFGLWGSMSNNANGVLTLTYINLNGTTVVFAIQTHAPAVNYQMGVGGYVAIAVTEGFNYLTPFAQVLAGTGSYNVTATGTIRG